MTHEEPVDLVAAIDSLIPSIDKMNKNYADLEKQFKVEQGKNTKNRGLTRAVVVGLALDLILSICVIGGYFGLHNVAENNKIALRASCEANNLSAQRQHQLWEFVINLNPTNRNNPDTIAFEKKLDVIYPTVDCSKPDRPIVTTIVKQAK